METIYNVYKIYSTGRRVKKPTMSFDLKDYEENIEQTEKTQVFDVEKIFLDKILPTLDKKLQKFKFEIHRKDLPQDPIIDKSIEEKKKQEKKRVEFLKKVAAKKHSRYADKSTAIALCMGPETEWKWQWCLTQSVTGSFYGTLSEPFDTRREADEWISVSIN